MKLILLFIIILASCKSKSIDGQGPALTGNSPVVNVNTGYSANNQQAPLAVYELVDMINHHRQALGIRSLILDEGLNSIAQKHSDNMASSKVSFGHSGFSARCIEAKDIIDGGNLCTENVALGQSTAKEAFDSWKKSSAHLANIEQVRSTHTGIGFSISSEGKPYWTQIFIEKN